MNTSSRCERSRRSGSILIEFSMIALIFYLLLASTIEMGRMFYSAQLLQDAARVAARELALAPLPATYTFEEALADPLVKEKIFDVDLLCIDLGNFSGQDQIDEFMGSLPPVNQALRPVMIHDRIEVDGIEREFLRYPGALMENPEITQDHPSSGFTVEVPQVVGLSENGVETIRWVPILEEIRPNRNDPFSGPFSLASSGPLQGFAAVRFNFPFQAATLSGFVPSDGLGPGAPNLDNPALARDEQVVQLNSPIRGRLLGIAGTPGTYSGRYGLGMQFALLKRVRPFRRMLVTQAIFRREVFQ